MAFLLDLVAERGTRAAVAAGIRLAHDGRARLRSLVKGYFLAEVRDDGGALYQVSVEYGDDLSDVQAASCTCPAFAESGGETWCSHIVASLLAAQSKVERVHTSEPRSVPAASRVAGGASPAPTGAGGRSVAGAAGVGGRSDAPQRKVMTPPRARPSDRGASRLLQQYRAQAEGSARAQARTETPCVLEAMLYIPPQRRATFSEAVRDRPFLRFKVGRPGGRLYIVKNLAEFKGGFESARQASFGKCSLTLSRDSFAPEALPMVDFLLDRYRPHSFYEYHVYARTPEKDEMALNPEDVDAFFAAFGEGALPLDRPSATADVRDQNYTGTLAVSKADVLDGEEGIVVSFAEGEEGGILAVIPGARRCYVVADGGADPPILYKCSEAWTRDCGRLVDTLDRSGGRLYFEKRDVPALYANILKKAGAHLRIESGEGVEAEEPPELVTRVWFDLNDAGDVTARMMFYYGAQGRPAFAHDKAPDKAFDLEGEIYAESVLRRYMGETEAGPGTLAIRANLKPSEREEMLFRLAAYGVEEIKGFAEVYVSESFDALKARPPISLSVGVKVDGRLLKVDLDVEGIDFRELVEVLNSYRRAKKYHRLRDGSFLQIEEDTGLCELAELAEGLDLSDADLERGEASVELSRAFYIESMYRKNEALRYDRDALFKSLVHRLRDASDADYELPPGLSGVLRGYQEEGYRWLKTVDALGFGGILADDMGLGKTLQALALIEAEAPSALPSIIVCPASLVLNWESEAHRFTPDLRVQTVLGTAKERAQTIAALSDGRQACPARSRRDAAPTNNGEGPDILVTSYDLLKRDAEAYKDIAFRYAIIDEAQYIKNQTTQNAKAVKLLNAQTRLALTGTPIENNLAELWSIFDFLMPGYLWNYNRFRKKYETPIAKFSDERTAGRLRELVRPFILRRLKSAVLRELPEKIETVYTTVMGGAQRKLYLANLARAKKDLAKKLKDAGAQQGRMMVLAALTRMRQICCDPALVYEDYDGGSAKLEACLELLDTVIEAGHRCLLFSQFTSMLDIVGGRLEEAGIPYFRLDGATPKQERFSLMNAFNEGGAPVFLISLRAGGTGLNLTGADIVVHYDPWWNLSVQNQATDRAHRIGQENRVQVFKLIAKDTIEERILEMQERKARLAEQVIREGGDALTVMTDEELLSLFDG
ncbi:MAG: SNF2 helicase associated domain-containing protein [Clostridiales Family XIII bacterium]|jgi:superfamily II DNA or RNA helicase|nr:SNF2 helicase associated domain-containing protein [Clostridiales Family XIII bacterium]